MAISMIRTLAALTFVMGARVGAMPPERDAASAERRIFREIEAFPNYIDDLGLSSSIRARIMKQVDATPSVLVASGPRIAQLRLNGLRRWAEREAEKARDPAPAPPKTRSAEEISGAPVAGPALPPVADVREKEATEAAQARMEQRKIESPTPQRPFTEVQPRAEPLPTAGDRGAPLPAAPPKVEKPAVSVVLRPQPPPPASRIEKEAPPVPGVRPAGASSQLFDPSAWGSLKAPDEQTLAKLGRRMAAANAPWVPESVRELPATEVDKIMQKAVRLGKTPLELFTDEGLSGSKVFYIGPEALRQTARSYDLHALTPVAGLLSDRRREFKLEAMLLGNGRVDLLYDQRRFEFTNPNYPDHTYMVGDRGHVVQKIIRSGWPAVKVEGVYVKHSMAGDLAIKEFAQRGRRTVVTTLELPFGMPDYHDESRANPIEERAPRVAAGK